MKSEFLTMTLWEFSGMRYPSIQKVTYLVNLRLQERPILWRIFRIKYPGINLKKRLVSVKIG
jgi:hypothetical protein